MPSFGVPLQSPSLVSHCLIGKEFTEVFIYLLKDVVYHHGWPVDVKYGSSLASISVSHFCFSYLTFLFYRWYHGTLEDGVVLRRESWDQISW